MDQTQTGSLNQEVMDSGQHYSNSNTNDNSNGQHRLKRIYCISTGQGHPRNQMQTARMSCRRSSVNNGLAKRDLEFINNEKEKTLPNKEKTPQKKEETPPNKENTPTNDEQVENNGGDDDN